MHLLYVDESGSVTDSSQKYFVLAGVCVFERQTHWVEQNLDALVQTIAPNAVRETELHGSPIRSGKGQPWRKMQQAEREQVIISALNAGIVNTNPRGVRLFAIVVEKAALQGQDVVDYCFEQLAMRFDLFLQRCYFKHNDRQRGLMLFDESSTENRLQTLARDFKSTGHTFGKTRNYAEVPVFLDSKASRLIQLADLVAYSIFRHFESGDSRYFNIFKDRFDEEGGVEHGFHVYQAPIALESTLVSISTATATLEIGANAAY